MLNQLLEEISHSEKSFKEKATRLKLFSEEVEASRVKLQLAREENVLLQGEMKSKALVLSEANETLRTSKVHMSLLTKQKDDLVSEKQRIEDQLNQLMKDIDYTRQSFISSITEFSVSHRDNLSKGCYGDDMQLESEMSVCKDRIAALTSELSSAQTNWEDMSCLLAEHSELQLSVDDAELGLRDAMARYSDLERDLSRAQKDLDHLSSTTDVNVAQLQRELEKYRQRSPEDLCKALKRELETAQQDYYQRRWRKTGSENNPPLIANSLTWMDSTKASAAQPSPVDDDIRDCSSFLDLSLEPESLLSLSVEGFDQNVASEMSTHSPIKKINNNKKVKFQYSNK